MGCAVKRGVKGKKSYLADVANLSSRRITQADVETGFMGRPETQTILGVLLRKEYKTAALKLGKVSLRVLSPIRDLKLELYFLHGKFTCLRVKAGEDRKHCCLCIQVDGRFLQEHPSRESTATQGIAMNLGGAKVT